MTAYVAAKGSLGTFYVSPAGSDSNPGTSPASPFLTPQRAQAAVRAILSGSGAAGSVVVYLRGGTYRLAAPLALTTADGGAAGQSVTWQGYPGDAKPVLSGGIPITGWTLFDAGKNVWAAPVPAGTDTRSLYVNGVRCARVHSADLAPLGAPITSGTYGVTYSAHGTYTFPAALPAWGNTSQIEMVFDHPARPGSRSGQWPEPRLRVTSWGGSSCSVAGPAFSVMEFGPHVTQDQAQVAAGHHVETAASGAGYTATTNGTDGGGPGYVENAYELFTGSQPGQFYLSKSTSGLTTANTLYYQPRPGERMAAAAVTLPVQQALVTLTGASNLTLGGLQFSDTTWLTPNTYGYPEIQTGVYPTSGTTLTSPVPFGQWAAMPAAVQVHGGSGLAITGCAFQRLGAAGLSVDGTCTGIQITGNTFTDISGNGAELGGPNDYKGAQAALPGSAPPCQNVIFSDNYLHDFPTEFHGCVPVMKFVTQNSSVTHNLVRRTPYSGIADGLGWSSVYAVAADAPNQAANVQTGNSIAWNDVGQTFETYNPDGPPLASGGLFSQTDGGNLYTNCEDAGLLLANNYLHEGNGQQNYIYCDNGEGYLTITGNLIVGNGYGNILAQDGFGGNTVYGNWTDNTNPLSVAVNGYRAQGNADNGTGPTILPGDPRINTIINGTSVVQTAAISVAKSNYSTALAPWPALIASGAGLEPAWRSLAPTFDQATVTNPTGAALLAATAPASSPALGLSVSEALATATLTFAAPRFVGAGLAGYTLLVNGTPVSSAGPGATSLSYDDLQPSTAYTFAVQPFGTDGQVGASRSLSFTTDSGVVAKTTYTTYKAAN